MKTTYEEKQINRLVNDLLIKDQFKKTFINPNNKEYDYELR